MKLHSLTADTPAGCVTYHSLTVDLPLQRYFFVFFFTRVSTCIYIRLHHFSNRGESRTVHGCGVVLDLILMRWFVSSVSGKNKRTHTHTHTQTNKHKHKHKYTQFSIFLHLDGAIYGMPFFFFFFLLLLLPVFFFSSFPFIELLAC